MIECRPATPEDFDEPPVYRVRAWTAFKDGRKIGIGGLGFPPGMPVVLWAELTDELRKHPVALHKIGLMGMREARASGVRYMVATTDIGFEAADRWIKRLGFVETGEVQDGKKVHAWFAS
jgi:hypothetical protein